MSTTLQVALTAVALAYPTPDRGEPPDARAARLDGISGAVVEAAERATCSPPWFEVDRPCRRIWPGSVVQMAAMLWSLGYLESGYAEWVHAGRCRLELGECDAQRQRGLLVATAISPWQLKQTLYSRDVWDELSGKGAWSTFQAAWTAARVISASRRACERWAPELPWLTATISAYATGGACSWPRAGKRAQFVVRIEGRLRDQLQAQARQQIVDRPDQDSSRRVLGAGAYPRPSAR
jgi:hypothetical protein